MWEPGDLPEGLSQLPGLADALALPQTEPVQRVEDSSLDQTLARLRPPKGQVIILPAEDPPESNGIVLNYMNRYPQAGWVMTKGETVEEIEVGDLVLVAVEGIDVAHLYSKVLEITFKSGRQVLFDMEIEPVIHETVEEYRCNPTTHERRIRASALDGEGWQFLASDVLSYQEADTSSPAFSLLYPEHVRMFHLWDGTRAVLLYEVHEDDILARIHV